MNTGDKFMIQLLYYFTMEPGPDGALSAEEIVEKFHRDGHPEVKLEWIKEGLEKLSK